MKMKTKSFVMQMRSNKFHAGYPIFENRLLPFQVTRQMIHQTIRFICEKLMLTVMLKVIQGIEFHSRKFILLQRCYVFSYFSAFNYGV